MSNSFVLSYSLLWVITLAQIVFIIWLLRQKAEDIVSRRLPDVLESVNDRDPIPLTDPTGVNLLVTSYKSAESQGLLQELHQMGVPIPESGNMVLLIHGPIWHVRIWAHRIPIPVVADPEGKLLGTLKTSALPALLCLNSDKRIVKRATVINRSVLAHAVGFQPGRPYSYATE